MGADDDVALGTLRISMGWNTKEAEVDVFIERWKKIATRVQEGVKAEAEKVTA
jgi:cysteine sulfinate desulfinase/cysteine desulfurase-like protein